MVVDVNSARLHLEELPVPLKPVGFRFVYPWSIRGFYCEYFEGNIGIYVPRWAVARLVDYCIRLWYILVDYYVQ